MQAVANTVLTLRVEEPLASHAGSVTQARRYRVVYPLAYLLGVDTSSNVSGCTVLVPIGSDIYDLAIEERWSPGVTMTGPGRVTVVREPILVDHVHARHAEPANTVEQSIENDGPGRRCFGRAISHLLQPLAGPRLRGKFGKSLNG